MFDFHHLYVFVNIVQHGSFSKAAAAIFLSQSTVSTHVQNLERELGIKLFDRTGRELVLTPAGEKFYEWAVELLAMKDKAIYEVTRYTSVVRGTVKIAASTVPGQYILPDLINDFKKMHPQVFFHVFQYNSEEVAEQVVGGKMEVGLLGAKYYEEKLAYFPFADDELVLIAPPGFNHQGKSISPKILVSEKLIMRNPGSGTRRILENALAKSGVSLNEANIVASFDSTEAVKQAVRTGLGVGVVSRRAALDYLDSGYIKMYFINGLETCRNFYVVYRRERTLSPAGEKFLQFLKERSSVREKDLCG